MSQPVMVQQVYALEVQMTLDGFWAALKEFRGGWHIFPTEWGLLLVGVSPFMVNNWFSQLTASGTPACRVNQASFITGNPERVLWCPVCEKPH